MERKPAVAGQFYPGTEKSLTDEVNRYLKTDSKPVRAIACVAPHAGYIYSGGVAGRVFASVEVPKRCIVLCPNHTGMGASAAVWTQGSWEIPTGTIPVDSGLAAKLVSLSDELAADPTAHLGEHSLEVELPFMLARQPELTIVPIAISRVGSSGIEGIGKAIADVVKGSGEDVLSVASTDMNHYEDDRRTREKDELAIDRVLHLDAEGLVTTCASERISMCGVIPTAITIVASKELGAKEATLVEHATSGDVSGDRGAVVGYAGFIIK